MVCIMSDKVIRMDKQGDSDSKNVVIEGEEIFNEALAKQKGIIVISGHLGNWEMALQYCPCYLQMP